jgi:NTP pyrophosphatase (non-canonical NTP hydrolase)
MKVELSLNQYQELAKSTAVFPEHMGIIYCALALGGESGEAQEKVKKVIRDSGGEFTPEKCEAIAMELGDVLWYLANLADQLGFKLSDVAQMNLDKLQSRKERGVIQGSGDAR